MAIRQQPLIYFGTPVEPLNLPKKDVKSRLSGEGFEPPAYGFEDQESGDEFRGGTSEGTFVQKVHNYDDQTVLCTPSTNVPP